MIENRELGIPDYLAAIRRRAGVILIPMLIAPLGGYLVSRAIPPRYTSQSLILIEDQTVPQGYVKPVVTEDILLRLTTMQQQVLSRSRLQPMIERLGLVKNGKTLEDVIAEIRAGLGVQPVAPGFSSTASSSSTSSKSPAPAGVTPAKKVPGAPDPNAENIPGFNVSFTADNAADAQRICNELTSMFLQENLKEREEVAQQTTDFLSRQVEQAKNDLDAQDAKLATFKKQYLGQLPGDEDSNLKILMGLNSQLDANTQTLNRAQQDRTYAESVLQQSLASWKASQSEENPQSLQDQLTKMQSQLIELQARYTDDYPDVSKTKKDISEIQKKLKEINSAPAVSGDLAENANLTEPAAIRQLRVQIHQYGDVITQATREQKRLQDSINQYQGRVALSPAVEEQFKELTRDYETAQKSYDALLADKDQAAVQTDMERHQQGEQMRLLNPAQLPEAPTFPVWWMLTLGGLGAGLGAGCFLAVLLELQDKSMRNEKDVLAALEVPMLVAVPWVGSKALGGMHGVSELFRRPPDGQRIEV